MPGKKNKCRLNRGEMYFQEGFHVLRKKDLKLVIVKKVSWGATFRIKFHNFTILLKLEVWEVGVLQDLSCSTRHHRGKLVHIKFDETMTTFIVKDRVSNLSLVGKWQKIKLL